MPVYLDTHVIVWLYQKDKKLFSTEALRLIEEEDCLISPAVQLELEYLHETEKITFPGKPIIDYLHASIGLDLCQKPFLEIIGKALQLKWTRDPFDRILTAHAMLGNDALITKDRTIHQHYQRAVW